MVALKQLIRRLAYQLTRKRICEDSLNIREIALKREELSLFCLSTNPVISFNHDGQLWYFRECPQVLTADAYLDERLDRFFDTLDLLGISKEHFAQDIPIRISFDDTETACFRQYIARKRCERHFRNAMRNADIISERIHFSIWESQSYDTAFFEAFALEQLPEQCHDIAVYFIWNMRSAAYNYRLSHITRGKRYSFFSASRAIASSVIAEALGQEHLLTAASLCRLIIDNDKILLGVISPAAQGNRMSDLTLEPTASLQKELLCLNVLDVICNQTDHGPNNYNVSVRADGTCAVCAFDNDNPRTFLPNLSIRGSLSGCSPVVDGHGRIQRPHMDRRLAEKLRLLDPQKLRNLLKPYLNLLQIAAVNIRIRRLNRAIAKTQDENPEFLIDDWTANTVAEEINFCSAQTYLKKAIYVK